MSRALTLLFSIVCYAIFFATFLYLIAFVGDLPVPKTVDSPVSTLPRATKAIIDVGLIALFGLQHSVMARPAFKRAWTRVVPPTIERSVFVLFASAALIILFAFWLSVYMLIAIRYEERDLTDLFGEDYRRYRAGVGGLVPRFTRRGA